VVLMPLSQTCDILIKRLTRCVSVSIFRRTCNCCYLDVDLVAVAVIAQKNRGGELSNLDFGLVAVVLLYAGLQTLRVLQQLT
jgi:hypothetical protein